MDETRMDETRMGQIALLLLRRELKINGVKIRSGSESKREITTTANEIGINPKEFEKFRRTLAKEAFDAAFPE